VEAVIVDRIVLPPLSVEFSTAPFVSRRVQDKVERDVEYFRHLSRIGFVGIVPRYEPENRNHPEPGAREARVQGTQKLDVGGEKTNLLSGLSRCSVRDIPVFRIRFPTREAYLSCMAPKPRVSHSQHHLSALRPHGEGKEHRRGCQRPRFRRGGQQCVQGAAVRGVRANGIE
jgi:hypothetical protein